MKANEYYCEEDTEMADVIIESQEQLFNIVETALASHGYPNDSAALKSAVLELCRVTLAGEEA